VTWESANVSFGALHLGDHNLLGGVRSFPGAAQHRSSNEVLLAEFSRADLPAVIRLLDNYFDSTYSIKSLFRDEQRTILAEILETTLDDATTYYEQLYETHAALMRFLADLQAPLPRALQAAAEFVLNRALRRELAASSLDLERIHALLGDAQCFHVTLDGPGLAFALQSSLVNLAARFAARPNELELLQELTGAIGLADSLPFEVDLWRVQNIYFRLGEEHVSPVRVAAARGDRQARRWMACIAVLGSLLRVRIPGGEPAEEWLADLERV